MAAPVYKNQQTETAPRSQTTAVPWSHGMNEIDAAASFNAKVDKMAAQGYAYQGSIQISACSLLLIFTKWA
jgi:Tfp pilus assembly protein PilV